MPDSKRKSTNVPVLIGTIL